ncbi:MULTISPECIES: efflux RND transporter periplasmic adaptor subunit [unclassified Polaromonas]|uniref:efflux RND transporter periplasmic adaptor subunit n=1 Tax=unclassified Polaromonas TaxID=2638319 RepID=UPI000F075D87|nr:MULTISPECIES: efflux RND transporter periplasmic adaptor subunit [unclassified Polaromonas]AYQ29270.1 efflux RND transporter periplasmic adaptor subunit [Polaromonas sp. SP1]QGJ19616.1 efflux RND transporter periplasmic adaptor subunit [Polaromonas sp. Pch-P]
MDPKAETPQDGAVTPPRKRLSRRASIIGSVIAVLALAGTGWLAWHLTRPPAEPGAAAGPGGAFRRGAPSTTVGVATAEKSSIPIVLEALGTVTPQATVRVRPQVSGVLEKVLFKEGQMVKAGELLATIDPRQFEMALMQASGQRQRDEAQLESARVTLQRFKTLLEQDSIARQEVDTQAALVKQLEATVVIDKANEGTARLNLGYTRVVAPISGRVGLRTVDVGNVVSSGDANGVALITQVSPIDVVFSVPQDRAGELQQNASGSTPMKVVALDRTRTTPLDTGVFASLDNQVDTTTGTVRAKARFANSKLNLFPSQFVNVQLQVTTIEDAVVVPVTALRLGGSGDYVYVLNADRTVSLRPVKRGQATAEKIVIASGLKAGERVITEGADRLKDGASVVLPGDAPGAGAGAGGRRRGASAPGSGAPGARNRAASDAAGSVPITAPVAVPSPASSAPAAAALQPNAAPPSIAGPTAEQRQRMLDQVKDDPAALERRKRFLEQIDKGDPAALARWQGMKDNRRQGERPAQ